jgi:hypothetical protein
MNFAAMVVNLMWASPQEWFPGRFDPVGLSIHQERSLLVEKQRDRIPPQLLKRALPELVNM